MELTLTFMTLLKGFRPVFTAPSFATFRLLMSGWILSVRHRYVTDLIISSDSVGNGHFSDYHRFFSQASWAIDELWQLLAERIIKTFFGNDVVIMLAADDTQHLGFEDPANRTPLAVQRTAPMALFLYSLTIVWYANEGHRHVQFPERPWYPRKSEPSFGDMLTTLRRLTWEDKLSAVRDKDTPHDNPIELLTFLGTLAG